jgi:hypothetical protein
MEKKETFTDEAVRLLREESESLTRELREAAIREALQSRGVPVEVTASDVRKARQLFVRRPPALTPMTDLILRIYTFLGALIFIFGVSFPYIRKLIHESDPVVRTSFLIGVSGFCVSLTSLFMHRCLNVVRSSRAKRRLETVEKISSETEKLTKE